MSSVISSESANQKPPVRQRVTPSSTNLLLVDEVTASEEVQTLFAQYRERFGRTDLPGIVLCFATNAKVLKSMLELAENFLFGKSLLSRRHKEMIATRCRTPAPTVPTVTALYLRRRAAAPKSFARCGRGISIRNFSPAQSWLYSSSPLK